MAKRPDSTLVASWNWELISDKPLDWWVPRIEAIKKAWPDRVLVASIMAGSGTDKELENWQVLTRAVQDAGADAIELNFSCPHMDRVDMGAERRQGQGPLLRLDPGGEGGRAHPGLGQAHAGHREHRRGGRRHVPRRRRCDLVVEHVPVAAALDPETLEFEVNVAATSRRRARRPGDPAAVAGQDGRADQAFPDREFSGIGGIATSSTPWATSCSAAARCRSRRRRCSTTRSART
jgi:dihydropyrimidine dehydrogenase (NAD+) subunit PreA